MLHRGVLRAGVVVGASMVSALACSDMKRGLPVEKAELVQGALVANADTALSCTTLANAVTATTGNVNANAASLVDSYDSSQGAYGGSNVGADARIQAALSVLNNGGVLKGTQVFNAASSLAAVPVPAGAINLPLGSPTPGSVNINVASDSISLAPGNYVVSDLNVNFNGSIKISPPGRVSIWVTGSLNLGGSENQNGSPANLTFFVTSSGWANVNSNGRLFGNIYAPAAGVNLNSAVFGSVVGSSVTLNSGAAVHYDRSQACPVQPIAGSPPRKLPPPPNARGCYVGTWNGWASVPCTPFSQLPAELQRIPYIGGGQGTIPGYLNGGIDDYGPMPGVQTTDARGLSFGQVDTTVVNITPSTPNQPAEYDNCFNTQPGFCGVANQKLNTVSIQLNTNPFLANMGPMFERPAAFPGWVPGDKGWVQFVLQSSGTHNELHACIWQIDFSQGKLFTPEANNAYGSQCVIANGSTTTFPTQGRDLKPMDYASVAGSAFMDADGTTHDLGMVAELSWWDPTKAPSNYRGLYATVAADQYGLWQSGNWTTVSGTLIGYGGGSTAVFNGNASVLTKVVAGNCAETTTIPGQGQAGTSCTSTLPTSAALKSTSQFTDESNNLNIVPGTQTDLAFTGDGNNNVETQYLAATGSPAQCDATPHVFVKDYPADTGSTPSNLNGQAFWESPDVIVVAANGAATDPPITQVIATHQYSIWVKVHNDYGCADVPGITARVLFGDASLASPMWADVIPSSDHYFSSSIVVPRFGAGFVGPIPWMAPQTADPHQCLLAVIKGPQSPPPANMTDTPSSNQVAQRNIEIGNDCSWALVNGTGANGTAVITLKTVADTASGQPYTPASGDVVQVMFGDPGGQTFASHWSTPPGPNPQYTVTYANNVTTVQLLSTSFVSLPSVPLASNQKLNVSSNVIPAPFSGTTIDLQISAALTNGGSSTPAVSNGASCQATAERVVQ